MRKRVIVLATTLTMFLAVYGLTRMANTPSYSLLYSGLEPGAAGEVVAALEQRGVTYQVRGSAIFVDGTQRDELRMMLASEGLPLMSGQGYELLDSLTGFGTTAQMFDAAYWRAKEGELARTIQSSPYIRSARVHIANTVNQPFRPAETASASVTAVAVSGSISPENAMAMRYLVASAVSGLAPDHVSVIDGRSGAFIGGDGQDGHVAGAADKAAELRQNILRLLEARVGIGRAIVEVNVDTVSETESVTERTFDPDGRVPVSTETEETSNSASGSGGAAVTVASNLPEGDAGGGNQSSNSQESTTREIINFEVSEIRREVIRNAGSIKKISVAVLVDGEQVADATTGDIGWQPRTDEEMAALRDLVASAMGYDEARGDTLTLQNLQLNLPEFIETEPEASLVQALGLDLMKLIQFAVLALVALIMGLFVLRPILTRQPEPNLIGAADDLRALPSASATAPRADSTEPGGLSELPMMPMAPMAIGNGMMSGPKSAEDPVKRLKQLIEERQDEAVEILEGWMNDEGETA